MKLSSPVRVAVVLSCLAGVAAWANGCASDTSEGVADAPDGTAPVVDDGSVPPPSGEGGAEDGGSALPGADGSAPKDDAGTDAGDPYLGFRTVLGRSFNVNDVVVTPAGLIYVVGSVPGEAGLRGVVVRLLANGAIDVGYGTDGFAPIEMSTVFPGQPLRGVLQADGKLVLIGVVYSTPWDFALTRLTTTGALDTGFATAGRNQFHVGVGNDIPAAIGPGPSGGFVFTGLAFGASAFLSDIVVGRAAANGVLDGTFDGDGIATTSFGGNNGGRGVATVSGDRVLVAAQVANADDLVLVRYTSTGALDTTFATGHDAGATLAPGAGVLRFAGITSTSAEGMQKVAGGKFVVYGTGEIPGDDAGTTRTSMFGVRVNEDGAVDSAFHNGGGPFRPTPTGRSFSSTYAELADGRSMISGAVYEGPPSPFDTSKYWPAFVALGTNGNRDVTQLGIFQGIYVPHAYPGNDARIAALPNAHYVAVTSSPTSVEAFELLP